MTISSGDTIYCTGETDSHGQFSCTLPTAGVSYMVGIELPATLRGYSNLGLGFFFTPKSFPVAITKTLLVADAFVCCPYCSVPLPKTLHGTFGDGAYTLTWSDKAGWAFNGSTHANVHPVWLGPPLSRCDQTTTVGLAIVLTCESDGFTLNIKWSTGTVCGGSYLQIGVSNSTAATSSPVKPSSCSPLSLSGSIGTTTLNPLAPFPDPTSTKKFTITA